TTDRLSIPHHDQFSSRFSFFNWRPTALRSGMPKFAAVIFDMDGVIVNSEPIHELAFREIFAEIGYAASHGIDFPAYYGRSDLALWQDFIARHRPAQTLAELTDRKQRRFLEIV